MAKGIILSVFSMIILIQYLQLKPYFNVTTQSLLEIFSAIYMWTNLIVVFSKVIEGAKFNGALQIYLLGIPIICVLVYTLRETRLKLLMTPENRIQRLV